MTSHQPIQSRNLFGLFLSFFIIIGILLSQVSVTSAQVDTTETPEITPTEELTSTPEPTLEPTITPQETPTLTPTAQPTEAPQDGDIKDLTACDPILISPEEGFIATSQTVTFTWSFPEGCAYATHKFVLDIDSDMVYPFVLHIGIPSSIASYTLKIDTAENNKELYWGVQGMNSATEFTDWSVRSIHTDFPSVKISHSLPLFIGEKKGVTRESLFFLPKDSNTILTAETFGNYVTDNAVTWSIQSGEGTLSDSTGTSIIFNAGSGESDTVVRATSVQYPEVYDEFSIHTFAVFKLGMSNPESVLYDTENIFGFIPGMDDYEHDDVTMRDLLGVTIEGAGSIIPREGGITFYSPSTEQSTIFHLYLKPYPAYTRDITINTVYGGPINGPEWCFDADQWFGSGGNETANYPRMFSFYYQYAPMGENSVIKIGAFVNNPAEDPIQDVTILFRDNRYNDGFIDEFYGPFHLQLESGTATNGIWSGAIPFYNPICIPGMIMEASNSTFTTRNELFAGEDVPDRPETSGFYDPSFVVAPGVGADSNVSSVVQQEDGKLLIVGDFTSYNGSPAGRIARLNPDGSLDTTFLSGSGADWTINTVALQSDGKIMIGGAFRSFNGTPLYGIARLNEDGSVDSSFDSGSGFDHTVYTIQVQPDGKIFVGGNFSLYYENPAYDLIRLNSNGTVDTSFDVGIGADASITDSLLLSDGKYLIVGNFKRFNRITVPHLARVNPDGSLDQTFIPPFEQTNMFYRQYKNISLSSSGNIYFTGKSDTELGIVDRLSPEGVWDNPLSANRFVGFINSVAELVDGRILIAGSFNRVGINNVLHLIPHLALINANGSVDTIFMAFTNEFGMIDQLLQVSQTNIFAVGRFTVIDGVDSNGIALLSMKTPPTILSTTLPETKVGHQFNYQFKTLGVPLPALNISSGTLPTGLSFDPVNAELAGIPEEAGVFTFTVNATNGIDPAASKEFTLTVDEPLYISSISPSEIFVTLGATRDITITGTGFLAGDTVELDGQSLVTTYIDETQLTATIPGAELINGRPTVVTVHSTASGDLISNGVELLIKNNSPIVYGLSPQFLYKGNSSIQLAVPGIYFVNGSIVMWNGSERPTTFVSGFYLTALIDAVDLAEASTASVTVVNPSPGGGTSNSVPFTVLGYSPAIDEKLTTNKVKLDWDDAPDATQYTIQLSLSSAFTTNLINTTTTASEYRYSSALTNGKTYYWRIRPMYGYDWGDWLPTFRFYSMNPPLTTVLTSPANATLTNDNTPSLTWNAAANADHYQVQISKSTAFSVLEQGSVLDPGVLTYTAAALPDGIHYWRVRGIDSVGVNGAWSAYRSFTVDTVSQAVPVMVSPANGAVLLTTIPKLTAKTVAGAKYYQFQVDDTEDFVDPLVDVLKTTYYYTLTSAQALPFGTAWWRVQSVDAAGNPSGWSTPRSFVVTILKTPVNNSYTTNIKPVFTWAAASGALEYHIQVDDSALFDSPEMDVNRPVSVSYTPLTPLPIGPYNWRMQVRTASGWGNWTPVFSFKVTPALPPAPVLKSPANAAFTMDNTPTLEWNAALRADKYEIQISKLTSFSILEQNSVLDPDLLTYTAAASLPDGLHYWRVRSINYLNLPGAWSAYRSFTVDTIVPGEPTLSAPAAGTSLRGTPKYSWLAVSGAKYYQFEYASTDYFSDVIYTSGELTSLYLTPPLQPLGTYFWHVRAKDVAGNWGGWSDFRQIIIKPLLPVAPVLVSPASTASVTITTPTFNWNPVPDATTYEIQVDNNSTFSSPEAVGSVAATWFTSGYLANATYYWRVRAKNIDLDPGAWSAARSVKVNAPQTTTVVSVSSAGTFGNFGAGSGVLSENGRFVVFGSMSSNLVIGDTNETDDVFVHDQQTNITSRVSISSSGIQGNGSSGGGASAISEEGRFVAFHSSADNLVPGDTNNFLDVFVRDRQTNQTTRVSLSSSGTQGNERSVAPSISGDGRYVVFSSVASNLVGGDTNNVDDVFLHDRQIGQTIRISLSSSGTEGNGSSDSPSISGDGRFVTFLSNASNLVSGDTNGRLDIFVHDLITGNTSLVSISTTGSQANGDSYSPSISRGGRYVAFESSATNLDDRDTTDEYDIYLHDTVTGETSLVSVTGAGEKGNSVSSGPEISATGLFVAFKSCATNLVSVDTNDLCDIFVHDLLTGENSMASINSLGGQGDRDSYGPSISGDGRYVSFESDSWAFVSGDYLGWNDVFVHEFR